MDKNREIDALEHYVAELVQDLARLQGSLQEARALRQDMVVTPLWPEAPPIREDEADGLPPMPPMPSMIAAAAPLENLEHAGPALVRPDGPAGGGGGGDLVLSAAHPHVLSDPIPTFPF